MKEFKNLDQVQKGDIGEELVAHELTRRGYNVMKPFFDSKPHLIDLYAYTDAGGFYADVKTKARMNKWEATGIDANDFKKYLKLAKKNKVVLFFVDEMLKSVYYCMVEEAAKECVVDGIKYPNYDLLGHLRPPVVLFPLKIMKQLCDINEKLVAEIKKKSEKTRNYEYKGEQK